MCGVKPRYGMALLNYANPESRYAAKLADYEGQVREEYNESYKPNGNVPYEKFVQQEAKNRLTEEIAKTLFRKSRSRTTGKRKP